jgi:hypothetical protein
MMLALYCSKVLRWGAKQVCRVCAGTVLKQQHDFSCCLEQALAAQLCALVCEHPAVRFCQANFLQCFVVQHGVLLGSTNWSG